MRHPSPLLLLGRRAALALALACVLTEGASFGCRGHDVASRASLVRSLDEIRAQPRAEPPALEAVLTARMHFAEQYQLPAFDEGPLGDAQRALVDLDDGARFAELVRATDDARVRRLACLHGRAAGRLDVVVDACARLLDEGNDPTLAPAFAAALVRVRDEIPGVDDGALDAGLRWIEVCTRALAAKAVQSCAPLASIVHHLRMNAARRRGDLALTRTIVEESGLLTRYLVEGPLEGDVALVLSRAARGEQVPVRASRAFSAIREVPDGTLAPAWRADAGVYRSTATFSAEGDVELVVRSDEAFVLLVDGKRMLERPLGRIGFPTVARVGVRLSRGEHRLDVIGFANAPNDRISVHVLTATGAPAAQRSLSATRPASAEVFGLPHAGRKPSATERDFVALDEAMAFVTLRLAGFFVAEEDVLAVEKRLVSDLAFTPTALILAAHALEADRTLPSTLAQSFVAPLFDLVEARAAAHPDVALFRAEREIDEHPEKALREINRALARRPTSYALHRSRIHVALRLFALHDAVESAAFLSTTPLSPSDLDLAIQVGLGRGDLEGSARLERQRGTLDDDYSGSARARALLAVGARDEGLAELVRTVEAEPGAYASEMLWDLLELSDPEAALERMRVHLDAFPLDRSTWKRRIALERAVHGDDAARTILHDAERRFGAQRDLIDLAVELGARAPWADELERVDAIARTPPVGAAGDSGHALLMLDDAQTRTVRSDGTSHLVRAFVARIESKDGIDALGEIRTAPGEELLRLRVHKPDGQMLEPDFHDGVADVSLAGLSVGDVVEFVAVSFVEWPILDGIGFETRVLKQSLPARRRSYTVELARELLSHPQLRFVRQHGAPAPVIDETVDGKRFQFVVSDVEGVPPEDAAVSDEEALPTVGYSIGLTDAVWAALLRQRALPESTTSAWFEEAARIVAGAGPSADRLRRIERFVATRIDPSDGVDPLHALASGRGARVPLFAALARAVGLEAHPVALEVPALAPQGQPHNNAWSARGVRIRIESGDHFLVGDERLGELDALPLILEGARVLDLRPVRPRVGLMALIESEDPLVVDLPRSFVDTRPLRVQLSLEPEAEQRALSGVVIYRVPRATAGPLRRALSRASDEERRAIFEGILSASLTPLVVTAVSLPDLESTGLDLTVGVFITISIDAKETVRRFERLFPDGAGTAIGLFPSLARPLRHVERVRPMRFLAAEERVTVDLHLPAGATFTEVPEGRRAVAGPVSLSTEVEVTDGVLRLDRTLVVTRQRVEPEAWPSLRAQLARLVSLADAQVGFVWGRASASPL